MARNIGDNFCFGLMISRVKKIDNSIKFGYDIKHLVLFKKGGEVEWEILGII